MEMNEKMGKTMNNKHKIACLEKKWKEGTEKGEIAIGEREMRESENGKKKNGTWDFWRKRDAKGLQQ